MQSKDLEQQLYDLYARRGEAKSTADAALAEVKQYDNEMSVIVAQFPDMKHSIKGVASFGISASTSGYTYDKAEIDAIIATLDELGRWQDDPVLVCGTIKQMLLEARKETSRAGSFYVRPAKERV